MPVDPAMLFNCLKQRMQLCRHDVRATDDVVQGFVVGFSGPSLYCLHDAALRIVEAPLPAALHCFLQKQDVESAYQVSHQTLLLLSCRKGTLLSYSVILWDCMQVACLGVRESDWQALARAAAHGLLHPSTEVLTGQKHFSDVLLRDIIHSLSQQGVAGLPHAIALADAMAALVCAAPTSGQGICILSYALARVAQQ